MVCRIKNWYREAYGMKEKWKRTGCLAVSLLLFLGSLCGCKPEKPVETPKGPDILGTGGEEITLDAVALQDIQYELTSLTQEEQSGLTVRVKKTAKTGETIEATVSVSAKTEDFYYFIVDWGDGTWSYDGPYSKGTVGALTHRYKTAGEYQVKALCKGLPSGGSVGWSPASKISVSGDPVTGHYLDHVRPIGTDPAEDSLALENICDNNNETVWRSKNVEGGEKAWVGYEFDQHYRLDTLEIKISSASVSFPVNISIDYTTDRGRTWYSLPKYYYLYSYQEGRYDPAMNFPNPKGATLVLNLDGIVANGIRICAQKHGRLADPYLEVAEMRVTGDTEALFYTSLKGIFDADLNNMFTIFGTAATEPENTWHDPFRRGVLYMGSAEWINWNGIKLRWLADDEIRSIYESTFDGIRTGKDSWSDSDGLVWATAIEAKHLNMQTHYSQNSLFIMEARNYLLMRNNVAGFLEKKNAVRQTLSDRLDKAMEYLLVTLEGESGVLTINDPENLALPGYEGGSESSNYWDRYTAFGYKSCYENIYFYQAVLAMADIEMLRGNPSKAAEYIQLSEKVKTEFNKLFWDAEKGRYIASVNVEGKRLDFGTTFINFMACVAGLTSEEQAKQIYSWIDGERIIEGDTSTGADIYHFIYSARSNTLDFAAVDDNGYYWVNWNGDMYCYEKDGTRHGVYGNQMQNGGTIFYTSYYDLLGRFAYLGVENAYSRFLTILKEFHDQDQLRVFPYPTIVGYASGVIGEFPESGMVPTVFVEGFLGINPAAEGLAICPALPDGMEYAGVREYQFNDTVYTIEVRTGIDAPRVEQRDSVWFVEVPAEGDWILTPGQEVVARQAS